MTETAEPQEPSFLKTLWQMAVGLIGGFQPFVRQLQENFEGKLDHYVQVFEKRALVLILRGSTLFLSVLFLGFGFLFVLMDSYGVPRGIACLGCGIFGAAALLVSLQFKRRKT